MFILSILICMHSRHTAIFQSATVLDSWTRAESKTINIWSRHVCLGTSASDRCLERFQLDEYHTQKLRSKQHPFPFHWKNTNPRYCSEITKSFYASLFLSSEIPHRSYSCLELGPFVLGVNWTYILYPRFSLIRCYLSSYCAAWTTLIMYLHQGNSSLGACRRHWTWLWADDMKIPNQYGHRNTLTG